MLAVFLSVHGAILMNSLEPGERFNRGYFCQQILEPLSQIRHSERATGSRRLIVHFGNATRHPSVRTENGYQNCEFHHVPQTPHSTDISPCDLLLFGDLRTKLKGEQFNIMEELQRRVKELLGQVASDQCDEYVCNGSKDSIK
jgi:hypothetical protein